MVTEISDRAKVSVQVRGATERDSVGAFTLSGTEGVVGVDIGAVVRITSVQLSSGVVALRVSGNGCEQ